MFCLRGLCLVSQERIRHSPTRMWILYGMRVLRNSVSLRAPVCVCSCRPLGPWATSEPPLLIYLRVSGIQGLRVSGSQGLSSQAHLRVLPPPSEVAKTFYKIEAFPRQVASGGAGRLASVALRPRQVGRPIFYSIFVFVFSLRFFL